MEAKGEALLPTLPADEPTGNLDGENARNIVAFLIRLVHEAGCGVVIVTHDPARSSQHQCNINYTNRRQDHGSN